MVVLHETKDGVEEGASAVAGFANPVPPHLAVTL
jgi:hypothetical protein